MRIPRPTLESIAENPIPLQEEESLQRVANPAELMPDWVEPIPGGIIERYEVLELGPDSEDMLVMYRIPAREKGNFPIELMPDYGEAA